jgi:GT2 family glycosyltransferase
MLESVARDGEIFDEDLFAYFEDMDLDWRAQRLGYRCLFVPSARGAHIREGTGLTARPEVAALLLANRFLVMMKNDDLRDVVADLWPIVLRTGVDLVLHARKHPRSIAIALGRLARLAPRMLAKRRTLRRVGATVSSPVRRFRLPTRFLG